MAAWVTAIGLKCGMYKPLGWISAPDPIKKFFFKIKIITLTKQLPEKVKMVLFNVWYCKKRRIL